MQEQFKNQKTEARQRSLLRFIHAQDSGGIVEGTSTYGITRNKERTKNVALDMVYFPTNGRHTRNS